MAKKEYDNRNTGTLFKNSRRRNNKDPEYTGTYTDGDGNEFWVSAWVKEKGENSQNPGEKFFSLSFRPKDDGGNKGGGNRSSGGRSSRGGNQGGEDDVPF